MIIEYFLVAVLHVGTPFQEIIVWERTPTERACQAKAQQFAEVAPDWLAFGCVGFSGPSQNTI